MNRLNDLRDKDEFTLLELLLVVLIIGILAAIAIPVYIPMTEPRPTNRAGRRSTP